VDAITALDAEVGVFHEAGRDRPQHGELAVVEQALRAEQLTADRNRLPNENRHPKWMPNSFIADCWFC